MDYKIEPSFRETVYLDLDELGIELDSKFEDPVWEFMASPYTEEGLAYFSELVDREIQEELAYQRWCGYDY